MIKIERGTNGWILTEEIDNGLEGKFENKTVFAYDNDLMDDKTYRKNEIEAFIKLLYAVNDSIGVLYSKHKAYNLNIELEKTH